MDEAPQAGSIIFDAGPIINMTLNDLLWVLPHLKRMSGKQFYITAGVREELIDRPLETRKYKLEAIHILPYIADGTIRIIDSPQLNEYTTKIDAQINSTMQAFDHNIQLLHKGELTSIAACILYKLDTFVVDERTARHLIETPSSVRERMEKKLHTQILVNQEKLKDVASLLKPIRCLRSVEIIAAAYREGIFCKYMQQTPQISIKGLPDQVLEGLLWGLKLNGCAISEEEVYELARIIKVIKKPCKNDH